MTIETPTPKSYDKFKLTLSRTCLRHRADSYNLANLDFPHGSRCGFGQGQTSIGLFLHPECPLLDHLGRG
jgi:hypothetical protein